MTGDVRDHRLVFIVDDAPTVVAADVVLSVASHVGPQLCVTHEKPQALDELFSVLVVQSRVASLTVVGQDITSCIGKNRGAHCE